MINIVDIKIEKKKKMIATLIYGAVYADQVNKSITDEKRKEMMRVWIAIMIVELSIIVWAIVRAVSCNKTTGSKIGYGLLAFFASEPYLIVSYLRQHAFKENDYCGGAASVKTRY